MEMKGPFQEDINEKSIRVLGSCICRPWQCVCGGHKYSILQKWSLGNWPCAERFVWPVTDAHHYILDVKDENNGVFIIWWRLICAVRRTVGIFWTVFLVLGRSRRRIFFFRHPILGSLMLVNWHLPLLQHIISALRSQTSKSPLINVAMLFLQSLLHFVEQTPIERASSKRSQVFLSLVGPWCYGRTRLKHGHDTPQHCSTYRARATASSGYSDVCKWRRGDECTRAAVD